MTTFFEIFTANAYLLKDAETKEFIKPMNKKQALKCIELSVKKPKNASIGFKSADDIEGILKHSKHFLYKPSVRSKAAATKHQEKLEALYKEILPFHDKNRTLRSCITVSNISEKHLGIKTQKLVTKKGADNCSFKTYEQLETPEYQYILIGTYIGKKIELRVTSDVFYDTSAPINKVFKVNAL